jgi:branched-chain amino acid transport system permease protein
VSDADAPLDFSPLVSMVARLREGLDRHLQEPRDEQLRDGLIQRDLDLVMGVADRITVLEAGSVIASGMPAEITTDPKVQGLFVGARHV